ncbi:MAG: RluA family pseudouridine synthase [Spirochaetia bacterium]|nr:RluA family pseudouridine synthase [Spirochaetia bacterium]
MDRLLRAAFSNLPLSFVYRLLRDGNIRVSGKRVDGSYRTKAGDTLEIRIPDDVPVPEVFSSTDTSMGDARPGINDAKALHFKELILAETPDLAFINKTRGLLSHGPGGIDELAKAYFADRVSEALAFIPAALHRLDRNTSGVLAVSASMAGAIAFSEALREGRIEKTYLALLEGELLEDQTWIDTLERDKNTATSYLASSGKQADSFMRPILHGNGFTVASIRLGTGRTHQIRIQAASRGHPLAGDIKYGAAPLKGGYLLHCARLGLPPMLVYDDCAQVNAPLPSYWIATLSRLFGNDVPGLPASYNDHNFLP